MLPFPLQVGGLGRMGAPPAAAGVLGTVLLLHFDGTNGSTTFTDNSPSPKTFTASGNAQISTTQSKFGGASLLLDGTGDWIETATSSDLSLTADFTIEAWIRLSAQTTNYMTIIGSGKSSYATGANWLMANGNATPDGNNQRKIAFGNVAANPFLRSTTLIDVGTWYHVAVTRAGSTCRLFINGTQEASGTNSGTFDFSDTKTMIGANGWDGSASHFAGNIDDLRVTKGVARYTANFTPPAAPF